MDLEEEFKKQTNLDAWVDNTIEPRIVNYKYVLWLEEKLKLQLNLKLY